MRKAWNKGLQKPEKLKRIDKVKNGLPIECKIHGLHNNWRVHSQNNVQCKLCSSKWQKESKNKDPLKYLFKYAKQHAKITGREFKITLEDLQSKIVEQCNRCNLSGIEFNEDNHPSLDRINSSGGYCIENIQLVLNEINRMKSNFSECLFIEMCIKVANKAKAKMKGKK
jgi:hypothetical protein